MIGFIIGIVLMICLLEGSGYYLARKIYQCIKIVFSGINFKLILIIFLIFASIIVLEFFSFFLPFPYLMKRILKILSAYMMGIFLYMILFFLIADFIFFLFTLFKIIPNKMIKNIPLFKGILVISITAIVSIYGLYNATVIKEVSYEVQIEKEKLQEDMNIVLISDIHLGAVGSEQRLEKIVKKINSLTPDIVCIAGDIFDNDYNAIEDKEKSIQILKGIQSKYGVYASLGNHDAGETIDSMNEFLRKSNITTLEEEFKIINNQMVLVGRLDSSPIGKQSDETRKEMSKILENVDSNFPIIVMNHNPINISEYKKNVDLILSGHTHKGQMFPANIVTNLMYEVDYGYYQKEKNTPQVIVTSGVGTWGMPMRVGTNCEIVNIKIYR